MVIGGQRDSLLADQRRDEIHSGNFTYVQDIRAKMELQQSHKKKKLIPV
jgi:hypothetical protein